MLSPYLVVKNATDSPSELNARLLGSIKAYISDYHDTSFGKIHRKAALRSAIILVQYIIDDLNVNIPMTERAILLSAFNKIHQLLVDAENNFDKIFNLKDAVGFISIIEL